MKLLYKKSGISVVDVKLNEKIALVKSLIES